MAILLAWRAARSYSLLPNRSPSSYFGWYHYCGWCRLVWSTIFTMVWVMIHLIKANAYKACYTFFEQPLPANNKVGQPINRKPNNRKLRHRTRLSSQVHSPHYQRSLFQHGVFTWATRCLKWPVTLLLLQGRNKESPALLAINVGNLQGWPTYFITNGGLCIMCCHDLSSLKGVVYKNITRFTTGFVFWVTLSWCTMLYHVILIHS